MCCLSSQLSQSYNSWLSSYKPSSDKATAIFNVPNSIYLRSHKSCSKWQRHCLANSKIKLKRGSKRSTRCIILASIVTKGDRFNKLANLDCIYFIVHNHTSTPSSPSISVAVPYSFYQPMKDYEKPIIWILL
jgi:hypothetical protein